MKFFLCRSCCISQESNTSTIVTSSARENHEKLRIFSIQELKKATDNFSSSNKIGEGGSGAVYKGRLVDGGYVAVKVLSVEVESMRGEREFVSELATLSDLRHENLVKLQGCCVHGADRYLVYEFMENNSLALALLGKEENRMNFSWEARRNISLGIARGIAYLHEEVQPHILHRDIKASNILLDKNFTPKVSDFGLSRILRDSTSHVTTGVAGTLGYLAPEYAISGRMTRKSDVYGFGVLLLEILSGRSAVDFDMEHGEHYLVQKAWEASESNNLLKIVDPTLNMNFPEDEVHRFLKVGLLCVQEAASLRPKMSVAARMLANKTEIADVEISQPGLLSDLMNIKFRQESSSQSTSSGFSAATPVLHSTSEFRACDPALKLEEGLTHTS